jgi:hypothetical protein
VSFIRVSWRADVDDDDLVDAVAQAGFPVLGRHGRIYVLHVDGTVTQHGGTRPATAALVGDAGNELLLWMLPGAAIATGVRRLEERVECTLALAGSPAEDQQAAARGVAALLTGLVDAAVDASLDLPAG